ncbi:MAG: SDR family oxidoreductase [Candidatus Heimdallarchaeaceae archaeon]|jgi:NAD(P)-dependent dehydrogenase (short-subunit alcohol dehydrogenase family)
MKRILITGSNSGLGFEFTKQFLEKGDYVIASCRRPGAAVELRELRDKYSGRIIIPELNVSNDEERDKLFKQLTSFMDRLDILINNAGVRFGGEKYSDSLESIHKEDFNNIFQINSVAPLMMAVKFLPMLKRADKPIIINISSDSGSISRRRRKGGGFSYSASKAALNMITKALSVELADSGIIVISFHPGWVKTSMEYTENAPLMPNESISGMISVIERLEKEDTGKFFDWQGNEVPW